LLVRCGYTLVAAQRGRQAWLEVDGRRLRYWVRPDFLVEDPAGRRFVVEVKTGARAPDPAHVPTRRQLLEYHVVFGDAAGVLLVDVEAGAVREVRFPLGR